MGGVYPRLLRTFVEKFNWAYGDGYEDQPFIQQSFLFSLYLLSLYGDEKRPLTFYEEAYLGAFPALLDTMEPQPYITPREALARCYSLRTFHRFAEFFGLTRIEVVNRGDPLSRDRTICKLPLLDAVWRFEV
jgi:hypothetical protein